MASDDVSSPLPVKLAAALQFLSAHPDILVSLGFDDEFVARLEGTLASSDSEALHAIVQTLSERPRARTWVSNFIETWEPPRDRAALETTRFQIMPPGVPSPMPRPAMVCPTCGRVYYSAGAGARCDDDDAVLVEEAPEHDTVLLEETNEYGGFVLLEEPTEFDAERFREAPQDY